MKPGLLIAALLVVALAGCVTKSPYSMMMGPYYLEQKEYDKGVQVFSERLKENPQDATAAYFVGRYYLAMEKPKQALPFFDQAVSLDPQDSDYWFWKGVTHWALLEFEEERAAYMKTLALEPNHISANLYLGHNYLDDERWAEALERYDRVIELDKYNPEALYNRGLALLELGKDKEGAAALLRFLEYYPDGSLAMRATERLNLQGDYTYRNFILGQRNVTLRSMAFKPGTNDLVLESKESLYVIAAMMDANEKFKLHVVAYMDGNAAAAKARAAEVKKAILSGNPHLDPNRLLLSWFGTAETIEQEGKTFTLDESVQFITVVQ